MSEMEVIPSNWVIVKLGEIATYINGKAFKPTEWSKEGLPIIRIQNLNREKSEFNYCNFSVDDKYYVNKGDLLFAWSGTPDTSFGAHIWTGGAAVLNQHIFRIVVNDAIITKQYYLYVLNHKVKEFVGKAHGTAGLAHITKNKFEESDIYLPPLPEQHRIVAKIEELFTNLDKGIEYLKTAKQQLKVYRQAVLKWAFEGKLTEEWRNKQSASMSSGILMKKIKKQRDEYAASTGKNIKIIDELSTEQLISLPKLPEKWEWTKLNEITFQITDGTHLKPTYLEKGFPFLSVKNVRPGLIRDDQIKYISKEQHEGYIKRCKPEKGDILYTKVGATYGYAAINTLDYEFSIYVSLCLIKFPQDSILPKYLEYCINSNLVYKQAQYRIKGIGRPDLHLEEIRDFHIPICSISEQQAIVSEIESRLSVCDKIEESIEYSLNQAEALRQSILKKAFEGKLVSQDPDDEPASVLLERIRAEREKSVRARQAVPSAK